MTPRPNKLYIDLSHTSEALASGSDFKDADGYILASDQIPKDLDIEGKEILLQNVLPQSGPDNPGLVHTCICSSGLEETASLRDQYPEFDWVPRVDAVRQQTAYHFPPFQDSANFSTYQPVFLNQSPYLVDDGDISLTAWLEKAAQLGFSSLWLHARGAANAGKGLDLDLRERVLTSWSGNLWLSGGASTIMHIKYLVREGGIDALIVAPDLASELGCNEIRASLHKELAEAEMEVAENSLPDIDKARPADLPHSKHQSE